jgi:hypothetical protein
MLRANCWGWQELLLPYNFGYKVFFLNCCCAEEVIICARILCGVAGRPTVCNIHQSTAGLRFTNTARYSNSSVMDARTRIQFVSVQTWLGRRTDRHRSLSEAFSFLKSANKSTLKESQRPCSSVCLLHVVTAHTYNSYFSVPSFLVVMYYTWYCLVSERCLWGSLSKLSG